MSNSKVILLVLVVLTVAYALPRPRPQTIAENRVKAAAAPPARGECIFLRDLYANTRPHSRFRIFYMNEIFISCVVLFKFQSEMLQIMKKIKRFF